MEPEILYTHSIHSEVKLVNELLNVFQAAEHQQATAPFDCTPRKGPMTALPQTSKSGSPKSEIASVGTP